MRFTEHELTVAVATAAKDVLAAKKARRRSRDVDAAWDALSPLERFKLLDAAGTQILPVLTALPDVEVPPGHRPTYAPEQVRQVVAAQLGDDLGRLQRAVAVKARTALVLSALAGLPPRTGPGAAGPPP